MSDDEHDRLVIALSVALGVIIAVGIGLIVACIWTTDPLSTRLGVTGGIALIVAVGLSCLLGIVAS